MSDERSISTGKVNCINLEGGNGPILVDVERADYLGVACVKGRGVGATESHWAQGRITFVPLAQIKSIMIFDSIEDYREMRRKWDAAKPRKKPRGLARLFPTRR